MNAVIVLLVLSSVTGFALGSFSWFAIGVSGLVLAVVASAALQVQGFATLPGIAIIVACVTVNQIAYLAGVFANRRSHGPNRKKADAKPSWFV
jgi:hypothetical protein